VEECPGPVERLEAHCRRTETTKTNVNNMYDAKPERLPAHFSLLALTCSLDAVAGLDHIGFEADRPWSAMKLEEETAGIAQHRPQLIATPERCGRGGAILTYRL